MEAQVFQPKSFRIILLSIFCLSIGIVFAAQLPIVNGENDISKQASKQASNNLLTTLLPTPMPTPDQTPHTLVGSFYTLHNNLEAKLLLNNKGNIPLEVHPTLYNLQGLELQLSPVTVEPQSFRFINLSDWAAIGGESFRSGNIKLFHTGKDLVLGAQIYLTDETRSLSYEEKLTEKGKFDSRRQEAVWWMPSNDAKVKIVLTNTTDAPLSITGKLAKKPNIFSNPQTIQLAAHQTRVFDLIEDFPNGNQFANAELLALSLEHSGANDALLARVLLAETQRGYSNVVQFSNPNGGKSSEYQGVGFQIEDINGLHFAPIIIARNVGTTTATVNTQVPYTRINGTRGTITLPQKQLSAGEIGLIDTRNIVTRVQQEQIKVASLEVKYNTVAGSVIVASHSVSTDGNQVFRVPMWDPLGQRSPTGGYPWRVEGTSQTETYIKNITDQEQDYVAFLVWENGGIYMIGLKPIAAYETVHIDVKKLRDEQIPDERGRLIPPYVSSGQLQWTLRRKDNLPDDDIRANLALIGRSEQVDITKGITNNYACQNCCTGDFISGRIEAADLSQEGQPIEVGSSRTYLAVEEQQTCYGFGYEFTSENVAIWNAVWTSSNYNVANVVQGNVTGVSGGNATIQASWYPYYSYVYPCPPQGGGNPLLESSEEKCEDSKKDIEKTEDNIEKTEDEPSTSNFGACGQCQRRRWSNPYTAVKYVTVTQQVPVQKIQYQEPGSSTFTDISGTLYVLKDTSVTFKAIPNPATATFPNGTPVWSGTSGAIGTGQTKSVTFSSTSSSTNDYKTVIARGSANTPAVTVNVIVYELVGTLTPQSNFTGRSLIRFGLREVVDLSFTISPTISATNAGGLRWIRQTGTGQIDSQDVGTGIFTAPDTAESSNLRLEVLNGPSKGQYRQITITIIAPSDGYMVRTSRIARNTGAFGGAFHGNLYVEPRDVSFTRLQFSEGAVNAVANGYLGSLNNSPHVATVGVAPIGDCSLATGCRVLGEDTYLSHVDPPFAPDPQTGYVGDFLWAIPWRYHIGTTITPFTTANHICLSNNVGTATLEKNGAGPFNVAITAPPSGF